MADGGCHETAGQTRRILGWLLGITGPSAGGADRLASPSFVPGPRQLGNLATSLITGFRSS